MDNYLKENLYIMIRFKQSIQKSNLRAQWQPESRAKENHKLDQDGNLALKPTTAKIDLLQSPVAK